MRKLELHWQILIALLLAIVLGKLGTPDSAIFGVHLKAVADFVGELFLRALRMLVVPLIMASIISAVAGLGETHSLGRLGLKTAAYYITTSLVAILIGLVVVDLIQPGIVNGVAAKEQIGLSGDVDGVQKAVEGRSGKDVVEVFLRLVPKNVVEDAAKGEMLGLIFFSLLFGFFTTRIDDEKRRVVRAFWDGVYDIMLKITDWVIGFAPIGVFALVFKVVLTTGFDAFRPLLVFFFCVLLALALHLFVALPLLMRLVGGINPLKQYKAMAPALLMAFSTASSSATLPLTMDCVQDRANVSSRVSSFTLPLGATVNMDGTALYECVAAIFIAQAYGVHLTLTQQFTVVLIALLTSIGVAGIP
ncbi:MAG: dicarboxylate/amino acid:cation symporter, partial [Myxococcales bacterium]|nr:dicarboxylate/amino acid:cation symporter [Myxococcales bacterium]